MKNEKGKVLPCSEEPFNTETSKAIATILGVSLTDRTKQIKPLEIHAIPFPTWGLILILSTNKLRNQAIHKPNTGVASGKCGFTTLRSLPRLITRF